MYSDFLELAVVGSNPTITDLSPLLYVSLFLKFIQILIYYFNRNILYLNMIYKIIPQILNKF